jgi:hypothetical protein
MVCSSFDKTAVLVVLVVVIVVAGLIIVGPGP